jgi:hypothetical protein
VADKPLLQVSSHFRELLPPTRNIRDDISKATGIGFRKDEAPWVFPVDPLEGDGGRNYDDLIEKHSFVHGDRECLSLGGKNHDLRMMNPVIELALIEIRQYENVIGNGFPREKSAVIAQQDKEDVFPLEFGSGLEKHGGAFSPRGIPHAEKHQSFFPDSRVLESQIVPLEGMDTGAVNPTWNNPYLVERNTIGLGNPRGILRRRGVNAVTSAHRQTFQLLDPISEEPVLWILKMKIAMQLGHQSTTSIAMCCQKQLFESSVGRLHDVEIGLEDVSGHS